MICYPQQNCRPQAPARAVAQSLERFPALLVEFYNGSDQSAMGKTDSINAQTTFSPSLNTKLTGIVAFEDMNASDERPSSENRTSPELLESANTTSERETPVILPDAVMSTSRDLIDKSIIVPLNFHLMSKCWAISSGERMYLTFERRYGEQKAQTLAVAFGFDISRFYPDLSGKQIPQTPDRASDS